MQKIISKQTKNKLYRPEIDGLRGFAILAVLLNHFNKEFVPNGYLGVDIFFVISGYVITSSISEKSYSNLKTFLVEFYSRRLKRITPALTFFLIITVIGISLFCNQPSIYLKTALSASFGLSNIYLYQNSTDYFSTSTELNPFTHTWSLGVEEQFYFLYPILAWISGYSRNKVNGYKYFFNLLSFLATISLLLFIYLYNFDQPAAYFLTSSRFWEIASGCLLFLGCKKNNLLKKLISKFPSSLIFIFISIIMFLPFKSSAITNIAVVLLTSILLLGFKKGDNIYKLLTKKWAIFIGRISYSLYLWHWGILSLCKWTIGISSLTILPILFLIFAFSLLSYIFIESPLRGLYIEKKLAIIGGILLMFASAILSYTLGRPLLGKLFLGQRHKDINQSKNKQYCSNGLKNPKELIIVGDSHALKLFNEMKVCFPPNKIHLASVPRTSFPTINYSNPYIINKEENNKNNKLLKKKYINSITLLDSESKNKNIIIANRKPIYFYPIYSSDKPLIPSTFWNDDYSRKINKNQVISNWISKLILFAKNNPKANIIILLPPPEITTNNNPVSLCKKEWFRKKIQSFCFEGNSMEESILARRYFFNNLKNNVEKTENLKIFDSFDKFCNFDIDKCRVRSNGKLLYIDSNHLSSEGYGLIMQDLLKTLN